MPLSPVSPGDSRGIRNRFDSLCRLIALASDRPRIVLPLWAGLLLFASISELLPGDSAPIMAVSTVNDKLLHFSAYAVVAFVPAFGLRFNTALLCVITTELVGIGLEFAQLFVRQRSCDPYDIAANTAGVLAGVLLAVAGRSRLLRAENTLSDE
jgi:VanZ family protein